MNNDEINKYIHFGILKNCQGFQLAPYGLSSSGTVQCEHATGIKNPHPPVPDYCSDESPRRLLNEVVATVGVERVSDYLLKWAEDSYHFIGVTALPLATACVEAHKALKEKEL